MSKLIDRPWAIVYGPKYSVIHGKGLMYGLGLTRNDAWENAILVMRGYDIGPIHVKREKEVLKRKGMIAARVEVRLI